ncbi:hypothetical protein [Niabella ginsengisoli]|uniref:Uncharacterized protein n=1 Tax=Niabella ginsengisoli TaxID=522298 RepID=A0ABS9SPM5_9BACT|nr:hypothetical protein [Niabella ginsengisoli]MCH5600290.1 hypothetical protein [Niabella ginsengisoli]
MTVTKRGTNQVMEFETVEHVQQPMIQKVVNYFLGDGENPCSGDIGVETLMLMDEFTSRNW